MSVADVLSLTNDEAGRAYPFHLRAQVTLADERSYWLFLQEGPNGIYVLPPKGPFVFKSGDWIEAEGVTARGGFAPVLSLSKVKVVRSRTVANSVHGGRRKSSSPRSCQHLGDRPGPHPSVNVRKARGR